MTLRTLNGKELTDSEISDISRLVVEVITDALSTNDRDGLTQCMTPERMRSKTRDAYCAIYEEDNAIVGFGYLAFRNEGWEIKSMYVSKRGQGIGTQILKALEDEAQRRGITTLFLESLKNDSTLRFYQRNGYATEKEHDYARGIHCTIMRKNILGA